MTKMNVVSIYRYGNWIHRDVHNKIMKKILLKSYKIAVRLFCNESEIDPATPIGSNLRMPHNGRGVIIIRECSIGDNCVIRPQVIIGRTIKGAGNGPKIGNNVDIGVGAKVLGDVTIGDNVYIGANAVVVKDIPANSTAVGIPAKVIQST